MVAFSLALGLWLAFRSVNPWAGSVADVRHLGRTGPRYYRAVSHGPELDSLVKQASRFIVQRRSRAAMIHIEKGRRLAPGNPLFEYLAAAAAASKHDPQTALACIDKGNRKGMLRFYVDDGLSPLDWQWPEGSILNYMGRRMVNDAASDEHMLRSVLLMAHNIALSQPPDSSRIRQGLELRASAALRLRGLAKRRNDRAMVALCERLVEEDRAVRVAEAIHVMRTKRGTDRESRAWILSRAVGRGAGARELLTLYLLEKDAEWTSQLRRDHMHIRNLKGL